MFWCPYQGQFCRPSQNMYFAAPPAQFHFIILFFVLAERRPFSLFSLSPKVGGLIRTSPSLLCECPRHKSNACCSVFALQACKFLHASNTIVGRKQLQDTWTTHFTMNVGIVDFDPDGRLSWWSWCINRKQN